MVLPEYHQQAKKNYRETKFIEIDLIHQTTFCFAGHQNCWYFTLLRIASVISLFLCFFVSALHAQDSAHAELHEVTVTAYASGTLGQTAAAVNLIRGSDLDRDAGTSLVRTISYIPGVTMEERSPGSFRLNIRGSSLRAPFGVRNVKVYYNDIPFTDPGGTTYLNALGIHDINSLEIIKGPGSSFYGAGTGGVLLVSSFQSADSNNIWLRYALGSYGLQQAFAGLKQGKLKLGYHFQQSNGYREHSAMKKHLITTSVSLIDAEKQKMNFTFLYADLFYKTPGALMLSEYEANARQSRPAAGTFPSAEQAKAAIYQQNLLAGLNYQFRISKNIRHTTVVYYANNHVNNPAIRNYGSNREPHYGARMVFNANKYFNNLLLNIDAGAEWQGNDHEVSVYTNLNGEKGSLQTNDQIQTLQYFYFLQSSAHFKDWTFSISASVNKMSVNFTNSFPSANVQQTTKFSNGIAPRISLLKKSGKLSVYASVEKGFSPPAASELLPSGSALNLTLRSEEGWNKQIGMRGRIGKIYADINLFHFALSNNIVQRRDAAGGDFYINAGATEQKGLESLIRWQSDSKRSTFELWATHALHVFRYRHFKQINNDFSGNVLPGSAKHVIGSGIDVKYKTGFYCNLSYFYSDRLFLNDANTAIAPAYHLFGIKAGYALAISKMKFDFAAGAENLLNEKYSLGNDINAAGGRYYNVAAGRNFYVVLSVTFEGTR
jgi:iron complex outermembrane receptor protein